ncbi:MAG TPA: alpha-galactosidase [Desulfobacterales bacterium]|nr:alpha-galactosidase [Desulfobacterales bacterium]
MAKITLIGAGSTGFAKPFLVDIMSRPGLAGSTVSLMDIDEKKLAVTESLARKIARQLKAPNRIEASTDRRRALDGADYVVSVVLLHGIEPYEHALNTTLRHGVNASIGCTTGPSGVFMFLRYVPYQRAITKDLREVCPDCLYLHYSNPTTMVPWYVNLVAPRIRSIGMCHSVQHSASQIADYIGAPLEETRHWVAGVNHQAWFLRYEWNGKDAYPLLREAVKRPEVYEADIVRFEMLKFFGYFLTESSVHNSEYVPYFRRTKADIERYTDRRGGWAGAGLERTNAEIWRASIEKGRDALAEEASGDGPVAITPSQEYTVAIFNAIETNTPYRFNGNVLNTGLITNLPPGCCVEVPCLVDSTGVHPCFVGDLPPQCASLNRGRIAGDECAVRGAIAGDRKMIEQAIALDPLTAASLTLDEVHALVDELFTGQKKWIDAFPA